MFYVKCQKCEITLGTINQPTIAAVKDLLETMMLASHAAAPHTNHEILFSTDIDIDTDGILEIWCLDSNCPRRKTPEGNYKEMYQKWEHIPRFLIGAATVSFHTSHEGHRMRIKYKDSGAGGVWEWESPI